MVNRRLLVVIFALAALVGPTSAFGQSERGSITGIVQDTSKAALPGVSVKVVNIATNSTIELVSSPAGAYNAANLPPGTYRLEATLSGFQTASVNGIRLNAGATARVDVTMNIGALSETVTVSAQNAVVQTEDAKISSNMSNESIDQLPLVVGGAMRSVFDLVATVPESKGSGTTASLGGGQTGAFGATLDGISVNTNRNADTVETAFLTPSVEAITEFSVETNGFKPEFGQAGGGAITFASKSGTNSFHGSLYDFLRNDALDQKGYFEKTKGVYKQNNGGASWGGPLQIPHVYDGKNRTFFFASYEGFTNRQGANSLIASVPTPEMYNGDFSKWVDSSGRMIQIYDPTTTRPNQNGSGFIRDPFPGNIIPASRISAVAKQYIALARAAGLAPNVAGIVPGTVGYVSNNFLSPGGTSQETTNKYSLKLDHQITSNQRVSYLFNRATDRAAPGSDGPAGLPMPFNVFQSSSYDADLHRVTWDSIGSRMVNHVTVGINTFNKDSYSPNVGGNWKSQVCIPNAVNCNTNMGIIAFSEFATWGGAADNGTEQPRFSIKDDFTLTGGTHTVKMGFSFDRQQANGFGQQNIAGRAGFDFRETAVPGATTLTSGSSFASFLLGAADTGNTETERYLQQIYPYYAFYGQDDWRINDKLVFNYGARYEFTQPPVAGGDQYSDFSPTTPNPAVNNYLGALVFAGDGAGRTGTRSLFSGYYGAVSPRLSFAYAANPKTTVRAGVGRSYGRVTVVQGSSHFSGFIGQYNFASPDLGITPAFYLDQGMPSYPLPPQIDPSFANNGNVDWFNGQAASRPAVYDSWTVSMQREVRKGMSLEFDYNGTWGSNLQAGLLNPNQLSMDVVNGLIAKYGVTQAIALLNSQITSAAAVAAGFKPPYANFTNPVVQTSRTVAQSLRPYPQYLTVNPQSGGGDKTGSSHYQAAVLKATQRLSGGFSLQASYTYSHLMTDADRFSGSGGSLDAAHPETEWSIGQFDQPHNIKLNTIYELPFGEGRRWLTGGGIADAVLGGWRFAMTQAYSSGFPIAVTSNGALPIFNGTNRPNVTGADWRAPIAGSSFDPAVDKFLNAAAFVQPVGALGNAPRTNGDIRTFWNLNENISLAKSNKLGNNLKVDLRVEVFNVFNRVVFGAPGVNFSSGQTFGVISTQVNSPRRVQLGAKLYF